MPLTGPEGEHSPWARLLPTPLYQPVDAQPGGPGSASRLHSPLSLQLLTHKFRPPEWLSHEVKNVKCKHQLTLLRASWLLGPPPATLHFPLAGDPGFELVGGGS